MKINVWVALFAAFLFTAIKAGFPNKSSADQEDPFSTPRIVSPSPNTIPLSPEQALKTFRLPDGYHLETVASEPMVSEPAALAWDGNGRMYVAQLETYMQTVDAKGQNEPKSRIMLLEDTDGDGKMDKSSVFIDKLLSPRMILCIGHELLVNETNSFDIHAYKDTNGDGKADQKRRVYHNPKNAYGNVEHQRSGLDWNLDNWIYVTTDPVRFRYKAGKLKVDTLISGSNGQWGLTHDNAGRLFFSRAASGIAACGFHMNPVYGQLEYPDASDTDFNKVWPILKTPDVNGGPKGLRADSSLAAFTSVSGQSVFRGDRLPKSMDGDYFAPEPVGRLIRRANITDTNGKISLTNVYRQDEFIASTDMNFRPVNTYTGPDGCLYIVDMYRGIIQEATWAQPGTFLYDQIMSKRLDKNVSNGRIYRLVYDGIKPDPKPDILDAPVSKLVTYLNHPNGWWRDNAQKELIIRGDRSVIPILQKVVSDKNKKNRALFRLHALWTLEGLESVTLPVLLAALKDSDIQVRKAAVRISEPFLRKNDRVALSALQSMAADTSRDVLSQLILSLSLSKSDQARGIVKKIMTQNPGDELLTGMTKSLIKNEETRKYGYKLSALPEPARRSVIEGARIFNSLCAACHGPEGQGLSTKVAPPLIGKFKLIEKKEEVIKIMLHGLSGPVDQQQFNDQMPPMGANNDEWIASVLNYVRYDLCMRSFPKMGEGYINGVIVTPEQVKKVREQTSSRTLPWTWQELSDEKKKR